MERPLHLLLIDDEPIVHTTLGGYLRELGHEVDDASDGSAGLCALEAKAYDLAFVDIRMPGTDGLTLLPQIQAIQPDLSLVVISGHGTMETVVQALRLGAVDYLTKPVKLAELDVLLEKSKTIQTLRRDRTRLRATLAEIQSPRVGRPIHDQFLGTSPAAETVRFQIDQAVNARCDTILVLGETGTGKEVVARQIHRQAASSTAPFIAVNCPALAETLAESELFGHVKGAFTGAAGPRPGYFEMADGGTLFLDEIADLSPALQAKLLRVLETRSLRRVGGTEEIEVRLRIIAATNHDLEARTNQGAFRPDLFYRLHVYTIPIPPLRERPGDIQVLATHFLEQYLAGRGLPCKTLSPDAADALFRYPFPGNARELRNLVERAAILADAAPQIGRVHLGLSRPETRTAALPPSEESVSPQEAERILRALEECKWNRRQAALRLGMPYSTLRYKIERLGLAS